MASGKQGPGGASRKGKSAGRVQTRAVRQPMEASARYTPPIPRSVKRSAKWVGPTILALFILGGLTIILNYFNTLPGHSSGWYMLGGGAGIVAGLVLALNYR